MNKKLPNLIAFKSTASPTTCTYLHISYWSDATLSNGTKTCDCFYNLSESVLFAELDFRAYFRVKVYRVNGYHYWSITLLQIIRLIRTIKLNTVTVVFVVTEPFKSINNDWLVFTHFWRDQHWYKGLWIYQKQNFLLNAAMSQYTSSYVFIRKVNHSRLAIEILDFWVIWLRKVNVNQRPVFTVIVLCVKVFSHFIHVWYNFLEWNCLIRENCVFFTYFLHRYVEVVDNKLKFLFLEVLISLSLFSCHVLPKRACSTQRILGHNAKKQRNKQK